MNDAELLRRYVQEGSQEAFAELVRLRIGLVYSAALRQAGGDAHRAEDVTQAVFTDLARKAAPLCRHSALIGWLYTSTRYTAAKMARSERRRRTWEQEASTMHEDLVSSPSEVPAERLRPLLDEAMHDLSEADRRALLLRFFDGCSMAELGRNLGLSEPAAQKRVERALEKLKILLARRGLSSTAAAVGAALSQEAAAAAAPFGLAAAVSGNALAAAASAPGLGLVSFLVSSKLAAGLTGLVLAVAVGTAAYEIHGRHAAPSQPGARVEREVEPTRLPTIEVVEASGSESAEPAGVDSNGPAMAAPAPQTLNRAPQLATVSFSVPALQPPPPDNVSIDQPLVIAPPGAGNTGTGAPVFEPSQLDEPPAPLAQPQPAYPPDMLREGITGQVVVDFTIDATGLVRHAFAASSSRTEFESAAVSAVSRWRFKPGRKAGGAVNTHLQAPIVFVLKSHD